eukprot:7803776-Pyramimonas_sp.AAC.1
MRAALRVHVVRAQPRSVWETCLARSTRVIFCPALELPAYLTLCVLRLVLGSMVNEVRSHARQI